MSLSSLSVIELSKKLKKGEIKSEELVKNYIEQINKKDKQIEAWEFFEPDLAISQAKKLDADRQAGNCLLYTSDAADE